MTLSLMLKHGLSRPVGRASRWLAAGLGVVGLLSGVFMFFGDLVRNVNVAHKVDFMVVSSYGMDAVSTSNVKIKKDMSMSVEGKHVSERGPVG